MVYQKVGRWCDGVGAYCLFGGGRGLCLKVARDDEGGGGECFVKGIDGFYEAWYDGVGVAVLDIIYVTECQMRVLCLECGEDASSIICCGGVGYSV